MQDRILSRIKELEESHGEILKKLADFDDKHEKAFDAIHELGSNIDSVLKKSDTDTK